MFISWQYICSALGLQLEELAGLPEQLALTAYKLVPLDCSGSRVYAIAKDELEIAAESTAEATIYAASDRISMREAFDDLKHTYGAYADNNPPPQDIEPKDGANGVDVAEERSTAYDSTDIPDDIRAEIKRRVGHRIREIENAVNSLEESARHE
ncbi:hypothetical protein McanCB49686_001036 [Microsporum canis]